MLHFLQPSSHNQTHLNFKIKNYIKKNYVVGSRILKSDKFFNILIKHMKATVMLFKKNKNKIFGMRRLRARGCLVEALDVD